MLGKRTGIVKVIDMEMLDLLDGRQRASHNGPPAEGRGRVLLAALALGVAVERAMAIGGTVLRRSREGGRRHGPVEEDGTC